jgi:hypothetical protein
MKYLLIEYADPNGILSPITLSYQLRSNPVVTKWVERVQTAQQQYSIDDPSRFYGFGSDQKAQALIRINKCIDLINMHQRIVDRKLESVEDQDTLNYLHNIFEKYHGLLDQQTGDFWARAPDTVRRALADLNIAVHRCEAAARGSESRHVVTWFGLPKNRLLDESDYTYAEHTWAPGTVFLNYVEIGKTVEDLATDNDQYIADGAFQPFRHYSADFVVRFSARTYRQAAERHAKICAYYRQYKDKLGPWQVCYTNGQFPLADIVGPLDLDAIANRQLVKSVQLI